jgi:5'-3' exonuclease
MEYVCFNWYYPHILPPLWEWLREYVSKYGLPNIINDVVVTASDIQPQEQLCLVLPLESWGLITNSKFRELPFKAPQYFPSKFSFDSVGKRYFWECEANIPIPSIHEIKQILSS